MQLSLGYTENLQVIKHVSQFEKHVLGPRERPSNLFHQADTERERGRVHKRKNVGHVGAHGSSRRSSMALDGTQPPAYSAAVGQNPEFNKEFRMRVSVAAVVCSLSLTTALMAGPEGGIGVPREKGCGPQFPSTGTVIVDVTGTSVTVTGRTSSRLEANSNAAPEQLARLPHAIYVLDDGAVFMKPIMYQWRTSTDLQVAVPYSEKWQVRALYFGGLSDSTKTNAVQPLVIHGYEFATSLAAAPLLTVDDRNIVANRRDCVQTGTKACWVGPDGESLYPHTCWDCWWSYCGDPYYSCH